MHILIVDDIEDNLYLLQVLLSTQGHSVVKAKNGKEALGHAQTQTFDLIISDILMPVMDGFALCHEWKRDQKLKNIPFVFYTATYTGDKDREFALGLGADAFLIKPTETQEFLDTIRSVTEQADTIESPRSTEFEENNDYYQLYNSRLIQKLEDKMKQLEQKNRELQLVNGSLETRVQQRTAELENSNKELESFSYTVSHDLRSPLRTLAGFSQILMEDYGDKLDDEGHSHLQRIRQAAFNMNTLIDDILHLFKITRCDMKRGPVNLSLLAHKAIQKLENLLNNKHIKVEIEPNLQLNGDEALLGIAMDNLISNAWKYSSQQNKPEITVGSNTIKDKGVVYYVRDNGVGFDMKYKDKLFHPFQRLHQDQEFEGSGIGLATVRRIIERHGGEVWAESEQNHGATFYFSCSRVIHNPSAETTADKAQTTN